MSSAFSFVATVGAAEVAGSSSAVYTVTVRTNLAEYREHGEGAPAPEDVLQDIAAEEPHEDALDNLLTLVTIPERTITVKRTYSAFREVSWTCCLRCHLSLLC
jgi:hypothetical protein